MERPAFSLLVEIERRVLHDVIYNPLEVGKDQVAAVRLLVLSALLSEPRSCIIHD
jgi:hypothetical protein